MTSILIFICVLAFACNGFGTRLFQTKFASSGQRLALYQALFCMFSTLLFWCYGRFLLPDLKTLAYGVAFGVFFFLACAMSAKGYLTGSMALTSVIMNMSLIIPMTYSLVFFGERWTPVHVIGILLFFSSIACSAWHKGDQKKASLLWLAVVLIGFLSNGMTATIQKIYVTGASAAQGSTFLAVAYFTATLCFAVKYAVQYFRRVSASGADRAEISPFSLAYAAKLVALSLFAGIGSFGGNLLLGQLAPKVHAAILYPCVNGGLIVFTSIISFLFFKEKPTVQKILSILLGCTAIVILNVGG